MGAHDMVDDGIVGASQVVLHLVVRGRGFVEAERGAQICVLCLAWLEEATSD